MANKPVCGAPLSRRRFVGGATAALAGAVIWPPLLTAAKQPGRGLKGQLAIRNGSYVDGAAKPVLPVFCHYGEAFSAYTRRPEAVRAQLDVIAKAGYLGIRFWDLLGYNESWHGKEVGPAGFTAHDGVEIPATPNYYDRLAAFLRDCRRAGLKVQWSRGDMQMLNQSQREAHFDRLAEVASQVGPDVVGLFEGLNEAWQNGEPDPGRLAALVGRFRARHPKVLGGLSCPGNSGEEAAALNDWSAGQDVYIVHGFRGGRNHDRIRHIFAIAHGERPRLRLGWQGEPGGPGSSVAGTNDPETLCLMAATALMSRQAWVYMSGFGVRWNGAIESQPGFYQVARVAGLLPRDLMRYETLAGANDKASLFTVGDASEQAETRIDQAIDKNGRFVAVAYGPGTLKRIRARYRCRGKIVHPSTRNSASFDLQPNQLLSIPCDTGRILLGNFSL